MIEKLFQVLFDNEAVRVLSGRKLSENALKKASSNERREIKDYFEPISFNGDIVNLYSQDGKIIKEIATYELESREMPSDGGIPDEKYYLNHFEKFVYNQQGFLESREVKVQDGLGHSFNEQCQFCPAGSRHAVKRFY